MKSVRYHRQDGRVIIQPVHRCAKQNGIKVREVPALIEAWVQMKAVKKRSDGGIDVVRWIDPKDPQALGLMRKILKEEGVADYCTKLVKKGTGVGMCDTPLDKYGNCPNNGKHVTEEESR